MSRRDKKTPKVIMKNVNDNAQVISSITQELVERYCGELDRLMDDIHRILYEESSQSIDNDSLENYILQLASTLYFAGSAQEDLGIKEDICKSIRQEVYNKARSECEQGTVADKDNYAKMMSQVEEITLTIYSRSYKKVKLRMEAGYEMLNSLKKAMNRRIAEAELSHSRFIGGIRNE